MRRNLAILTSLASLAFLLPGIQLPMIRILSEVDVDIKVAQFKQELINQERSIVGTALDLYQQGYLVPSTLILLFSILIPLIKILGSFSLLFLKPDRQRKVLRILSLISKWSMADVFVVALLIVLLSTRGNNRVFSENISVFGMEIPLQATFIVQTTLLPGFYFFLAYCLCAIANTQIMKWYFRGENPPQAT